MINLNLSLINLNLSLINLNLSLINLNLGLINLNVSLIYLKLKRCIVYMVQLLVPDVLDSRQILYQIYTTDCKCV